MAQDAIINRWDINGDVYDIQDAGRGRPLGVATLDENGRVPYTQLPESAVEFKGYWDASTNTPTLHDGTGTKGDMYYVSVAGTQNLGSGSQEFEVGDRVLYDGSVWMNMKSGGTNIEVYPTMADLQQDLPNLEDGTIVATEEGDAFTTVDTVQSGVFNPVTSNAVANYIKHHAHTFSVSSSEWRQSNLGMYYCEKGSLSSFFGTNNYTLLGYYIGYWGNCSARNFQMYVEGDTFGFMTDNSGLSLGVINVHFSYV